MPALVWTPEIQEMICELVEQGAHPAVCARAVGISETAFSIWMSQGREGLRAMEELGLSIGDLPRPTLRNIEFYRAVTAAEARCERRIVANWEGASRTNWRAGKEFLAVRFRERWGPHEPQEAGPPPPQYVEVVPPDIVEVLNGKDKGADDASDD